MPLNRTHLRLPTRLHLFGNRPRDLGWALVILAAFVLAGLLQSADYTGDDLAASYIGCRVLAAGQPEALFSHDPEHFSEIAPGDTLWHTVARSTGFTGYLHPYVQTPLWAAALQPLCTRTTFPAFRATFTVLTLLSFATLIFLVARFWTPQLLNPVAVTLITLVLWFSTPFQYALFLCQTHILFVLLTVAALHLAERRQPLIAGLLLALAAAVKVTPAFLVLYWLLTRRYRAAASMVVVSTLLVVLTLFTTGHNLFAEYVAGLDRVSRILLVSQNNQSLAASVMAHRYAPDEIFDLQTYALPNPLRFASTALILLCTTVGALLDRRRPRALPLGAMMALLAATLFTPIAWTHYFILLIAPVMLLLEQTRAPAVPRARRIALLTLLAAVLLLNLPPVSTDVINGDVGPVALVRAQFFSGLLCLVALTLAAWPLRDQSHTDLARATPEGIANP